MSWLKFPPFVQAPSIWVLREFAHGHTDSASKRLIAVLQFVNPPGKGMAVRIALRETQKSLNLLTSEHVAYQYEQLKLQNPERIDVLSDVASRNVGTYFQRFQATIAPDPAPSVDDSRNWPNDPNGSGTWVFCSELADCTGLPFLAACARSFPNGASTTQSGQVTMVERYLVPHHSTSSRPYPAAAETVSVHALSPTLSDRPTTFEAYRDGLPPEFDTHGKPEHRFAKLTYDFVRGWS